MRPTPFYVQVTLGFAGRRHESRRRPAGPVPVRRQHLQRREADRAAGGAGVLGAGSPEIADHPGGVDPRVAASRWPTAPLARGTPARRPQPRSGRADRRSRNSRDGRERHAGRGRQPPSRSTLPQGWTRVAGRSSDQVRRARTNRRRCGSWSSRRRHASPGEFHVRAVVTADGQTFNRGYQVIEYPHIRRQHIYDDADAT